MFEFVVRKKKGESGGGHAKFRRLDGGGGGEVMVFNINPDTGGEGVKNYEIFLDVINKCMVP